MAVWSVCLLLARRPGRVLLRVAIETSGLHPSWNTRRGYLAGGLFVAASQTPGRGISLENINTAARPRRGSTDSTVSINCIHRDAAPPAFGEAYVYRAGDCLRAGCCHRSDTRQPFAPSHAPLRDSDSGSLVSGGGLETWICLARPNSIGAATRD